MASEEEKALIRKRGSLKSRVTSFLNFLQPLEGKDSFTEQELFEIRERLDKIEKVLDEFEEVQTRLELIAADPEGHFAAREEFESRFYKSVSTAKCLLGDQVTFDNQSHRSNNSLNSQGQHSSGLQVSNVDLSQNRMSKAVKLPDIKLPTFSGQYTSWLEYRDTFTSLIHDRQDIDDVQKFHYLRASLEGTAAQVIKSIEFSASNYNSAYEVLCKRFNNKNLLINNHLDALFSLEKITKSSSAKLRNLSDSVCKHLRALNVLGQNVEYWDLIIIHSITKCLDSFSLTKWEEYKLHRESPTLDDMYEFLESRAELLDRLESNASNNKHDFQKDKRQARNVEFKPRSFVTANDTDKTKSIKCSFCQQGHMNHMCDKFLNMSVEDRMKEVKNHKLCENCLRYGHFNKQCKLYGSCKWCGPGYRHNSHLCLKHKTPSNINEKTNNDNNVVLTAHQASTPTQTLLSTVLVHVTDHNKRVHSVRCILDSGSMCSFVTQSVCRRLNLRLTEINYSVCGLNNNVCSVKYKTEIELMSRVNNFKTKISCLVLPEITTPLPAVKLNVSGLKVPNNITLADPTFYEPNSIDILIGVDLFWQLLSDGNITLGKGNPVLQNTKFGWIISGNTNRLMKNNGNVVCNFSRNEGIEKQLLKFFELEEVSEKSPWSQEEKDCEAHFNKTFTRLEDGRFEVSIPLKESVNNLGDSLEQAKNRFFALERRMQKNGEFKERYSSFLKEYENLGHMTKIAEDVSELKKCENSNSVAYFLPHHGVLRELSTTTKLRVVFDASAPTTSGLSLNDIQMVGPTIQDDLVAILLRFRQHQFVISADIEKMYRQISVSTDQRHLQLILWRRRPEENLSVYALNTVTYGMACSPFLAIRCLIEIANESKENLPDISEIIAHDFYVDDVLSGCSDLTQAQNICSQLKSLLKTGCFPLRKWRSNDPRVLEKLQLADRSAENERLEFGENESTKTLGLLWSSVEDKLMYNIKVDGKPQHVTKRQMLSCVSKIFDPLSLLSPCVILAKIMVQQLWQEKLSWDEPVPLSIYQSWTKFITDLPCLNQLKIARNIICKEPTCIELHLFSDASEVAYGGCAYVRSSDKDGNIYCHLLFSKSKVAPTKPTTIPRLELCGAFVVAKLANKVQNALRLTFDRCVFWTDSKIVLGWINTSANLLKPFVRNRVIEIQDLTNVSAWRYVPSSDNPADLLSRGLSPKVIGGSDLWWHGPLWLHQSEEFWPNKNDKISDLPELKAFLGTSISSKLSFPFDRFSNLSRLKRCCAYILRFKRNCLSSRENRVFGPLTVNELEEAFTRLIHISQVTSFPHEYENLSQKKDLHPKSKILSLSPFIDSKGLLRVGGRLKNTQFSFDKRHPILLSSKDWLTKLILENEHKVLLHAGPQQLLFSIREKFWPVSGRNLAKSVVHKCITCHRFKTKNIQPLMGDLPANRFLSGFPFQVTGIDYAGPILIKEKKGRGAKLVKSYIALFVCFSTKSLHLELVSDLSTETFLLALKRFIARRGKPLHLYSDNGTTFRGANRELKELGEFLTAKQAPIEQSLNNQGINWHFIPAYAPNFGGLWEAGVKSTKHHLKRIVGNAHLTFEELTTLLTQIEAILNSRPLSPLSTDPTDPHPLTPAHFLVGRPLTSTYEPNLTDLPETRLSRYQRLEQLRQHFWARWHKEFISELQLRTKWKFPYTSLQKGALVLIKEDNVPPLDWRLGRVTELFPGKDNVSRVASIRTSTGTVRRACSKICPLPVQ